MRRDGPVRLLLVVGSPLYRARLSKALAQFGVTAVPGAANTAEARDSILAHHPDIILLDLELVRGDALNFLRKLRDHYPVPVFALTRSGGSRGAVALQAVELGAIEVLARPDDRDGPAFATFVADVAERIRQAAAHARPVPLPRVVRRLPPASWRAAGLDPARYLVAIGASTGGTEAIRAVLTAVPPDFPPVVIVQHMPAGFTRSFAERLDAYSPLRVTEAVDGEVVTVGRAVVARGDTHLEVRRAENGWRVRYTHQTPVNNHCPAVDVLFESVAQTARAAGVGLLLTGMGRDGARGMAAIRAQGGLTLAQNQASCIVYGMPKAAVDLGAVEEVGEPAVLPVLALRLLRERLAPAV